MNRWAVEATTECYRRGGAHHVAASVETGSVEDGELEWESAIEPSSDSHESPPPDSAPADTTESIAPADLSPTPVSAHRVALPFAVTWDDLSAVLPMYGSGGVAWRTHLKSGVHQGGDAQELLTITYLDSADQPRSRALFIKYIDDPQSYEAARYRYLGAREVPVARLIAAFERLDAEVLVLEWLPQIGIRPEDADHMLSAAATLNAITDAPDSLFSLSPGMDQAEFENLLGESLSRLAVDHHVIDPMRWSAAYRRCWEERQRLPFALTHGEFAPQQVGMTVEAKLVMFDLETAGHRPRFSDVASVLRTLSTYTGRAEPDLFASYLGSLSAARGTPLEVDKLWSELLLTRIVVMLESLPWRTTDPRLSAEVPVTTIAEDLAHLDER